MTDLVKGFQRSYRVGWWVEGSAEWVKICMVGLVPCVGVVGSDSGH
jgi:hypothetical protein